MRKNFGAKTISYTEPVFIIGTYNLDGTANAMNAAWAGIYDTNQIYISLSDHKTCKNFKRTHALTVSFGTEDTVKACDYVGLVSGTKVPNKVAIAGLTPVKSDFVDAPYFEELKVSLDCTINTILENKDGIKIVCDIVNVNADVSVLTDGAIDPVKLKPLMYDPANHKYYTVTSYVADAFKVGKELIK